MDRKTPEPTGCQHGPKSNGSIRNIPTIWYQGHSSGSASFAEFRLGRRRGVNTPSQKDQENYRRPLNGASSLCVPHGDKVLALRSITLQVAKPEISPFQHESTQWKCCYIYIWAARPMGPCNGHITSATNTQHRFRAKPIRSGS